MKKILYVIGFLILLVSCSKENKNKVFNYSVVDSFELEKYIDASSMLNYKNQYFVLNDLQERKIYLIDNKGRIKDSFGRNGKGPKEFKEPQFIELKKNFVYILDKKLFKIVKLRINKDDRFEFEKEIKLNKPVLDFAVLGENKIVVSLMGNPNNIQIINEQNEIIIKQNINCPKKFTKQIDALKGLNLIEDSGNHLLFAGLVNLNYCFYKFYDGKLVPFKEEKTKTGLTTEKILQFKENGPTVKSITALNHSNDKYYILLHRSHFNSKNTFYEVFSKDGNYLGKAIVEKSQIKISTFSDDGENIWFIDENGNKIYHAEIK